MTTLTPTILLFPAMKAILEAQRSLPQLPRGLYPSHHLQLGSRTFPKFNPQGLLQRLNPV